MLDTTSPNQLGTLILALMVVAVAIAVCGIIAFFLKKKFNFAALGQKLNAGARLSIVETVHVDQKRKLILIQKDGTEHLILIGGPTDLVIEATPHHVPSAVAPVATNATVPLEADPSAEQSLPDTTSASSEPTLNTEQDAIDFFDQARDRIFTPKEQTRPSPVQKRAVVRDDTDDFRSVLQAQQNNTRRTKLEPIPETAEERVAKLTALLEEARKSRKR